MNSTQLIAEVRQLWLGPSTTELLTDDENILLHADRVLEDLVMPAVLEVFEEYMIAETRETPSTSKVQIPSRAFNGKVRKVEWRNTATSSSPVELELINRNESTHYSEDGQPGAWYFEGDYISLMGDPSGVVDISFPFKPSSLVDSDNYRIISALGPGTNEITLTQAVPSSWSASNTFDLQDASRSGMLRYWDLAASSVSGTQITFSSEIAGTTFGRRAPVVGDFVSLAGQCGRPMAPEPLHGTLGQGVVARIAQSQGDVTLWQVANAEFTKKLGQQARSLDRRVEQKRVLINHNSRFRRWGAGLGRARRRFV